MARFESVWRFCIYCGVVQDMPVVCLGFPCMVDGSSLLSEAGWGNSSKGEQVGHRGSFQAANNDSVGVVNCSVNLFDIWAPTPNWGAIISC